MKKNIVKTLLLVAVVLFISGCTIRTNYMRKYKKELHTVFGEYVYEYLGLGESAGYEGISGDKYKIWKITFDDVDSETLYTMINNLVGFDRQIVNIYKNYIERSISNKYLCECINCNYIIYGTVHEGFSSINNLKGYYKTKEYDYFVNLYLDFNIDSYYVLAEDKITDYNFFDLTKVDLQKLIDNNIVKISRIKFIPSNKDVLSNEELESEREYLINLLKTINDKVPVEKADYSVYEYKTDLYGKEKVETKDYELLFK